MTIKDFAYDHPDRDVAAFKRAVANKLIYAVGKDPVARPARTTGSMPPRRPCATSWSSAG
jgi:hypothetical protein